MRNLFIFGFFFLGNQLYSQLDTEVYLADLEINNNTILLSNPRNVSNNAGYDNQPSFYDKNSLLFASTREGQTDIKKFNILEGSTSNWLSDTPTGSEYSPLRVPEKNSVSAIRLDMDGLQRLYEYEYKSGSSKVLVKNAKIGYHVWYTPDILVATLLVENRMDLIVYHLSDNGTYRTLQKNVGRSLQNIPNTDLLSFISKENPEQWELKSIHPITGATEKIVDLKGTEDICWLPDGSLITGMNKSLFQFHPKKDTGWKQIQKFNDKNINNISRLAINEDGSRLAFVAEPSLANIVQKQVEAYNSGDLEAFVNCYTEDVYVSDFPSKTRYVGRDKMRENYGGLSPENKVYQVEVVKRIQLGNVVIDQEKVTGNGKIQMQVALYEVTQGKIASMRFIFDDSTVSDPEAVVQKQMDAYNARAIDAFAATYADEIEVYNFPNTLLYNGKEKLNDTYSKFFETTPDLNYIVKNRIVIANYVIDEEEITAGGNTFSAVAIYEVQNGKISKVTFIQ